MVIKVTKEHIGKGYTSIDHCPIALALKDAGFDVVYINTLGIGIGKKGKYDIHWNFHACPESVIRFINRFDNKSEVQPFEFILGEK